MKTVALWTGREIRAMRMAKRMTVREFAEYIGVGDRMVSKWEAGGERMRPRPFNQGLLDTAYKRLSEEEASRFESWPEEPAWTSDMPAPLPRRTAYAERYATRSRGLYDPTDVFWREPRMTTVLARRDIPELYRLLQRRGVPQRKIAALTDQSQSEISEIISGRHVTSYDVIERIALGLGIPRGHLGLAYGPR